MALGSGLVGASALNFYLRTSGDLSDSSLPPGTGPTEGGGGDVFFVPTCGNHKGRDKNLKFGDILGGGRTTIELMTTTFRVRSK